MYRRAVNPEPRLDRRLCSPLSRSRGEVGKNVKGVPPSLVNRWRRRDLDWRSLFLSKIYRETRRRDPIDSTERPRAGTFQVQGPSRVDAGEPEPRDRADGRTGHWRDNCAETSRLASHRAALDSERCDASASRPSAGLWFPTNTASRGPWLSEGEMNLQRPGVAIPCLWVPMHVPAEVRRHRFGQDAAAV